MKWYKILDGIGSGCTCSLFAAIGAMGIATVVGIWNNHSENSIALDERIHRVFAVSAVIFPLASAGAMGSSYLLSRALDRYREVELGLSPGTDARWETVVSKPEAWDGNYCLASCKGCKYLVGMVAPDKFMVCAIHPYGWRGASDWNTSIWVDRKCPDWKGVGHERK